MTYFGRTTLTLLTPSEAECEENFSRSDETLYSGSLRKCSLSVSVRGRRANETNRWFRDRCGADLRSVDRSRNGNALLKPRKKCRW
jgi:hypothetical protein